MAFDDYQLEDDGAYTFVDSFTGKTVKAAGVEAKRKAFEIDQRRSLGTNWGQAQLQAGLDDATEAERARRTAEAGYTPGGPNQSTLDGGKSVDPNPPPPAPPPPPVISKKSSMEAGAGGASGGDSLDTGAGGNSGGSTAQPTSSGGGGEPQGITRTGGGAAGGARGGEPWRDAYTGAGNLLIREALTPPPRGGGGSPVRTVETPTGRSVQISGGMKPANVAEQEDLARREAELGKGRVNIEEAKREEDRLTQRVLSDREKYFEDKESIARDKAQKELAALNEQRAAKLREIEKSEIDPQKFWGGMSAGRKAGAIASIFLGGVAQGLGGGPNEALQTLDKAIDRDIDAQKSNLQKKQWEASELGQLYETRRKQLGDDMAARNEVKAAALAQIKRQAQQLAMMTNVPAVQQRYAEFELEADKKIAALHAAEDAKVVQSQTFGYKQVGGGGGGGLSARQRAALLKEGGDMLKAGSGGGRSKDTFILRGQEYTFREGLSEGEKNRVRERAAAMSNAREQLTEFDKLGNPTSAGFGKRAQTLAQTFTYPYMIGKGQAQSTADNENTIKGNIMGLGSEAKEVYRKDIQSAEDAMIIQYGGQ